MLRLPMPNLQWHGSDCPKETVLLSDEAHAEDRVRGSVTKELRQDWGTRASRRHTVAVPSALSGMCARTAIAQGRACG